MTNSPINFPAINGIDGSSCDIYPFGWTSGCTYPDGRNKGFTQEWFFDARIGAWISDTPASIEYKTVNNLGGPNFTPSDNETIDVSFANSTNHILSFTSGASSSFSTTLRFVNPPSSNLFGEITLIVINPSVPSDLNLTGLKTDNSAGTVIMDEPSSGLSTADTLGSGVHMWKVWTVDGGNNYYVYRANGFGRFWDNS